MRLSNKRVSVISSILKNNTNALLVTISLSVLISFCSNLVLTRLLSPESFAIIGLVGSLFFVLNLVSDAGFVPYIIRDRNGDKAEVLDTVWSIKVIRGAVLSLLLAVASKPVSLFLEEPHLFPVFLVCSAALFFEGLQSLSHASAERHKRVAKPLYIELGHLFFSKIIIISIAWIYQSYWAFVVGLLVDEFAKVVSSFKLYANSRRQFRVIPSCGLDFWQYSKVVIPASILTVVLMQGDKLLLSKAFTLAELGVYYLAFNLSRIGTQFVEGYCTRVVFPYVSDAFRSGEGNFKERIYLKKTRILYIGAFGIGALAGSSTFVVGFLYPDEYSHAAFYLSILLLGPLLRCISSPAEGVLFTLGQNKIGLQTSVLRTIWVVIMSALCFPIWGAVSFVVVFSLQEVLPCIFVMYKLVRENLLDFIEEAKIILASLSGLLIFSYLSGLTG